MSHVGQLILTESAVPEYKFNISGIHSNELVFVIGMEKVKLALEMAVKCELLRLHHNNLRWVIIMMV